MRKFKLETKQNTWTGIQSIDTHSWTVKNKCDIKKGICITFTTAPYFSLSKVLQITANFEDKISEI